MDPQNIGPIFRPIGGNRPFSPFFFPEISVVQPFFREKLVLAKHFSTKNVSKNHENFFGEQHNIKELSSKNFWMRTQ